MLYPMDVERYVSACSLWLYHPDEEDEEIVPEGALTMDSLVEPRAADFGSIVYLRFVGPMGLDESAHSLADLRQLKRKQGTVFRAGLGRLIWSAVCQGSSLDRPVVERGSHGMGRSRGGGDEGQPARVPGQTDIRGLVTSRPFVRRGTAV
jgi:hypothetical protein